jgi:hypothetical protein
MSFYWQWTCDCKDNRFKTYDYWEFDWNRDWILDWDCDGDFDGDFDGNFDRDFDWRVCHFFQVCC